MIGGKQVEVTFQNNKIIFLTNKNLFNDEQKNFLKDESFNYNIKLINDDHTLIEDHEINELDLTILDINNLSDYEKIIDRLINANAKIGILLSSDDKEEVLKLLKLNLDGYFHSEMDEVEFNRAVNHVLKGNKYIHSTFTNYILKDYARLTGKTIERPVRLLSNREWEILEQMVKGYSNKMIGENLLISERTVKNHISSIFRKINVDDRTNAVVKAIRNNWVMLD